MYWRGNPHLNRKETIEELGSDYLRGIEDGIWRAINQNQFYREMARCKLALSLPGLGKACHREFEAFAVGTPVIMPKFNNIYYENLKPDYHYVSFDPKGGRNMGSQIKSRYHEVVDDDEFLEFIRMNAMQYYDEYIRCDSSIQWMLKLLEL
jgi:hypothetical protein